MILLSINDIIVLDMKKYVQQNLVGISPEIRIKLRILSYTLDKPITRLVELMTDRLWEEKQEFLSSKVSQMQVNREASKILKSMIPR